jgi:predicted neuraminidase
MRHSRVDRPRRLASLLLPFCLAACGSARETFPPEQQTPFMQRGLILPPNSLPCTPVSTGVPQDECNHHGSQIVELADGTVAVAWFHGEAEKSRDSRLVWSKLAPGAAEWTAPEVLYDDPGLAEGNVALWVAGDGSLVAFFVTIFGADIWDESKIRMLRSTDDGATWGEPVMLRAEYCWMVRHPPLRLRGGDLLLPLYDECMATPVFMYSSDDFATWQEQVVDNPGAYYLEHPSQTQPSLIQRKNGDVVALMRNGTAAKRIQRMVSHDQGHAWDRSEPTDLPNSDTSIQATMLLDGHVVVVFNNDPDSRFPLTAALSTDEGQTFVALRNLNDECVTAGACAYAYPAVMQSRIDGTIWVSYTHDRQTIGWVHFNEAWLAAGTEAPNVRPARRILPWLQPSGVRRPKGPRVRP